MDFSCPAVAMGDVNHLLWFLSGVISQKLAICRLFEGRFLCVLTISWVYSQPINSQSWLHRRDLKVSRAHITPRWDGHLRTVSYPPGPQNGSSPLADMELPFALTKPSRCSNLELSFCFSRARFPLQICAQPELIGWFLWELPFASIPPKHCLPQRHCEMFCQCTRL